MCRIANQRWFTVVNLIALFALLWFDRRAMVSGPGPKTVVRSKFLPELRAGSLAQGGDASQNE